MASDLKSAFRSLLRRPAVTALAALTLAVGIGSATAIFSIVYTLLVKPLEFPGGDRLVRIWELTPERERFSASGPDYADFVEGTTTFDSLAAFNDMRRSLTLTGAGDPARIEAVPVTASFFAVLGIEPAFGRGFLASEDRPGAESQRIVLSHRLWRDRFGENTAAIDTVITLDRHPYRIVGVMPEGFGFPFDAEAWVPAVPASDAMAEGKGLEIIGRLRSGVTIERARADVQAAAGRIVQRDPGNAGWSADLVPLRDWLVTPRFREAVLVLLGAVGCLLLLACANVANLLMAQASRRHGEMRMRVALGARRAQLVRLMFVESALLATAASALGLMLAMWTIAALRLAGGGRIPRLDEVALHPPVMAFALAATVVSCLVFGIAPALHASRTDLRASLDSAHRVTSSGRRARGFIVAVEVALAVVLLTGAGLLAVSFSRLAEVHPGFETANLLAVPVELPEAEYEETAGAFYDTFMERIAALPGVAGVGATTTNPFRQFGFANSVTPEEAVAFAPASGLVQAGWRAVTPGYFDAAGVPVIAGRAFAAGDRDGGDRVVMVSESLAARLWPDGSAVGRRILWGGLTGRPRTVIGVAGDIRDFTLDADVMPMLFLPHAQLPMASMTVLVRAARPELLGPQIQAEMRRIDPALPPPAMALVDDNRARAFAGPRFNAWLLGAFAAIAATLAATGVYAMLAFAIGERRREIAVRLALGARPATIVRMVVGEGMRMITAGLVAGLLAALWLTRYLASLLFGVSVSDPATFAAVASALVVLALAASLIPARQASRMD
ncbi:MAG: ABC transporter permease, partial [Acidobacteriota bacterium]|nr:ABC transporter permease [Acidobacteriota bacterium]